MRLRGAIFDMDGTVVDVPYDWGKIKAELETQGKPILTYIENLAEPERSKKWKILEKFESEATQRAKLKPGMREFLSLLSTKGVKRALVTNNSQKNVSILLEKFRLEFDCIISRERGLWKPSGAPILVALKELQLNKEECCVVGDSHFDVRAAEEAGIPLIFILNEDTERFDKMNAEVFKSVEALQAKVVKLLEREDG
jgi:HAD superfamily hydrolase (TIGR01549 family)